MLTKTRCGRYMETCFDEHSLTSTGNRMKRFLDRGFALGPGPAGPRVPGGEGRCRVEKSVRAQVSHHWERVYTAYNSSCRSTAWPTPTCGARWTMTKRPSTGPKTCGQNRRLPQSQTHGPKPSPSGTAENTGPSNPSAKGPGSTARSVRSRNPNEQSCIAEGRRGRWRSRGTSRQRRRATSFVVGPHQKINPRQRQTNGQPPAKMALQRARATGMGPLA